MATLAEQLADLEPQITSLQRANEERSLLKALRARSQQIAEARGTLDAALTMFARIERLGGSTTGKPRASAALRGKPGALVERLEGSVGGVAADQQWDVGLLTPLGQFSSRLTEWLRESWSSLVDKHAQPVRDDVLEQFERLGFGGRVRDLRVARDRIQALRSQLPADESSLNTVIELAEGMAAELGALTSVPPAVRTFFAKAARQEAGFEDFTTDVQDWLRANDMLKLIRIGFR
jgi:hypothetical protein